MLTNRQLFLRHIGQTSAAPIMLEVASAEGVYLYGSSGEKYMDLISGVCVSNTGHRHPHVIEAIRKQTDAYLHLMVYGEYIQSPQVKYAQKLVSLLPAKLQSVYFVNSGSEAVEGALKLARKRTGRSRVISFRNSYHGSTLGALSIQGGETWKAPFRPLVPDCYLADFNGTDVPDLIDDNTACVVVEPVQAEAGVILPENDFLAVLREKCNATGTLLVFDEVQTGFGRLGTMFGSERYNVWPDILILGKALGGGMPLGAFISSNEIMSSLATDPSLGHITTFGGHPVSCAAGLASLEVILEDNLASEAARKSELFRKNLNHQAIVEIRGEGLLLAVVPDPSIGVERLVSGAPAYGLVLDYFLFCNNAFRIAPPLTISNNEIEEACRRIAMLLDNNHKSGR